MADESTVMIRQCLQIRILASGYLSNGPRHLHLGMGSVSDTDAGTGKARVAMFRCLR